METQGIAAKAAAEAGRLDVPTDSFRTGGKGTTGEPREPGDSRAPVILREKFGGFSEPASYGRKPGESVVAAGSIWGADRMAVKGGRRWPAVGSLPEKPHSRSEIPSFP